MTTPTETLGRGIGLDGNFDASERNGSIPLVSGIDVLERDTAFALANGLDEQRGAIPDQDFAAEVELATRRVLSRDDRVASIGPISVDLDDGPTTVAVEVSLTVASEETQELITEI